MLNTNFTNIRDIQRNYRKVAKELNDSNKPIIVMSKNQPQFAIVSLQTLEELEQRKQPNSIQAMKEIAQWAEDNDINAPTDLSEKHNEYAWDK
jgi:PHD/YefM family antitoxin component YafN of YafNO toxin-antitoxin module